MRSNLKVSWIWITIIVCLLINTTITICICCINLTNSLWMLHVRSRQIECLVSMVSLIGPAGIFRRHWAWHMTRNVSVEPVGVTVWSQCPLLFLSAQSGVFIKWVWRVQKRISTYPIVHRYQFPVCFYLSYLVSTRAVKFN